MAARKVCAGQLLGSSYCTDPVHGPVGRDKGARATVHSRRLGSSCFWARVRLAACGPTWCLWTQPSAPARSPLFGSEASECWRRPWMKARTNHSAPELLDFYHLMGLVTILVAKNVNKQLSTQEIRTRSVFSVVYQETPSSQKGDHPKNNRCVKGKSTWAFQSVCCETHVRRDEYGSVESLGAVVIHGWSHRYV